MTSPRAGVLTTIVMALLLCGVIGLQAAREGLQPRGLPQGVTGNLLYVRSPEVMARAALSYRSLLADAYWIRALQHYGGTKRAEGGEKTVRPAVSVARPHHVSRPEVQYRISLRLDLSHRTAPRGTGTRRPRRDAAEEGAGSQPQRWEYAQDIGFVYYRARDYVSAADWFHRASEVPGAPAWMKQLEATTRAKGGDRQTSRTLWLALLESAGSEQEWLRKEAARRLMQLQALDDIDALQGSITRYQARSACCLRPGWIWYAAEICAPCRSTPRDIRISSTPIGDW